MCVTNEMRIVLFGRVACSLEGSNIARRNSFFVPWVLQLNLYNTNCKEKIYKNNKR